MKDHILSQGEMIKNYRKLVGIFKTVLKKQFTKYAKICMEASPVKVDLWGIQLVQLNEKRKLFKTFRPEKLKLVCIFKFVHYLSDQHIYYYSIL